MTDCLPGRGRHDYGRWYAGRDRRQEHCRFCGKVRPAAASLSATGAVHRGWTWKCRRCGGVVTGALSEPETVRQVRRLNHLSLCHREMV